jgi:hypothetical protein
MNAQEKRKKIIDFVEHLDDKELKRIYDLILRNDYVVGYEADGKAINLSQLKSEIDLANQELEKGDYTTIEDLEKESELW